MPRSKALDDLGDLRLNFSGVADITQGEEGAVGIYGSAQKGFRDGLKYYSAILAESVPKRPFSRFR